MPHEPPFHGFARTRIHREVVDSTSNLARALLEEGSAELPLLVIADRQTAGRGRQARSWWSDPGSLTFSLGLDPVAYGLRESQTPRIALAVAVSLIDELEARGLVPAGRLGLRWPNDVEAGGRKLAGILPEWVDTPRGRRVVVGVGLNVTTNLSAAPEDVRRMATSLEQVVGAWDLERPRLIEILLDRVGPALRDLGREESALARRWSELDTLRGRAVRVDLGERILAGRGAGITPSGGLRLEVPPPGDGPPETIVLHGGQVLRGPVA